MTAAADVHEGDVIRVTDWPGTFGERYVVKAVREAPGSEYPVQVDALTVDKVDGVPALAQLRTFPIDRVVVDAKRTRERARHLARVAERTAG